MSKINRLLNNYKRHISIPWQEVAPAQRVIFCIYHEGDERRLRAKIDEFEIAGSYLNYKNIKLRRDNYYYWTTLIRRRRIRIGPITRCVLIG